MVVLAVGCDDTSCVLALRVVLWVGTVLHQQTVPVGARRRASSTASVGGCGEARVVAGGDIQGWVVQSRQLHCNLQTHQRGML